MTAKFFRGLADTKWSNDANWSLSSGGPNDTTKAVAGDDVTNEASQIVIDTTEACLSFTQTSSFSVDIDGALNVSGALLISNINGLEGTGTVNVQGNLSYTDGASQSNTIVFTMDGTGAQNLDWGGTASAITFDLRINKASGTVTNISNMNASTTSTARLRLTLDAGTFNGNGFDCKYFNLTINSGTYNAGSGNTEWSGLLSITGGVFNGDTSLMTTPNDLNQSGGTFNATSGTLEFTGGGNVFTMSAGTFNHNSGFVTFNGNQGNMDINGRILNDFTSNILNPISSMVYLSDFTTVGTYTHQSGHISFTGRTIDVQGDFIIKATSNQTSSGVHRISGNATQELFSDKLGSESRINGGIEFAKTGGSITCFDFIIFAASTSNILIFTSGTVVFDPAFTFGDRGFAANYDWSGGPRIPNYFVRKANTAVGSTLVSNLEVTNFTNEGMGALSGAGVLDISGNVNSDNSITGSARIDLTGTANQTLNCIDSFGGGVFAINKPSGIVSLVSTFQNTATGSDFFMVAGTLDLKGFAFTVKDELVQTGGLINDTVGGGVFTIGRHVATAGTITLNVLFAVTTTSGVVFSDSAGYNLNIGTYWFQGANHWDVQQLNTSFTNMVIDKCPTCNYSGTQDIDGKLTVMSMGNFLNGSLTKLAGDMDGGGALTQNGGGVIRFDGTTTQTVSFTGIMPDIEVNKSSGTLVFSTAQRIVAGYNVIAGQVDWLTNQVSTSFVGGNNTFTITSNLQPFNNVTFDKTGSSKYTLLDLMPIANGLTITDLAGSFELSGFSVEVQGDIFVAETSLLGSTIIKMTGIKDAIITQTNTDWFDSDLVLEKTSGQVELGNDLVLPFDFLHNDAIFCTNEFDLTAANITIIANATFNKTPASTLTGTVTGTVNDVDDCEKKTALFYAV